MTRRYGLVFPLWTVGDEQDDLFERAIGEIGPDHVTVPVITGPLTRYRIHGKTGPRHFATRGGWHYPPAHRSDSATPVRPRTAGWFGKRNILARACAAAEKRGVNVLVRLDLRAVPGLLEHETHLLQRNAWGEPIASAGACVSNPDLRELLGETLDELMACGCAGYQIVDWRPDHAVDGGSPRPFDWQPTARKLLDICFCSSCRQLAAAHDVDPDMTARSVQTHACRAIELADDPKLAQRIASDELLSEYVRLRRADSDAWLQRVAARFDKHLRFVTVAAGDSSGGAPSADSHTPLLHGTGRRHDEYEAGIRECAATGSAALGIRLPVWRPMFEHAEELVRFVSRAQELGVGFFDFEDLDQAPDEALIWLRKAVRFARRD